ncbi:MAG: cyclic nucleotide-binding domain-containing protein, partial [Defluviitaleaceae bacterium]|nr:cyclic nucleotide-binding domain-containing protein [Defluviitaleaceae bacterium]
MPLTEFKAGDLIFEQGAPLQGLAFITKGGVEARFAGRVIRFEQGDMLGLCDLAQGAHSMGYTAATNVVAVSYPYEDFYSLESLMRDNADVANLFVAAALRQISKFLQFWQKLGVEANSVYKALMEIHPEYERLSHLYALPTKKLPGLDDLANISNSETLGKWVNDYYSEIKSLDPEISKGFFRPPGVSCGFLRKSAEDFSKIMDAIIHYLDYLETANNLLLSPQGHDLYAIVNDLLANSASIKGADVAVGGLMFRMNELFANLSTIDRGLVKSRANQVDAAAEMPANGAAAAPAAPAASMANLSDSLEIILDYSEVDEELRNNFIRGIIEYGRLSDKTSPDDDAYRLRRELTTLFNNIYIPTFIKTLKDPAPPTIVKMFLNFGYVDAALAGYNNAEYLYSIADSLKGNPEQGVYTFAEWLTAIYQGKKEPSRNDFDTTFADHVEEQLKERKISDKEAKRLLGDNEAKVRFELEQVFPIVNKITYGRITSFCPIFIEQNAQKNLDNSLVTPAACMEVFNEIRSIDFSAFYRENLFTHPDLPGGKEYVHVEVLPDVIMMPNIGVRGAMWQEIEGRNRISPARMFISVFLLIELKQLLMTLTSELRWELRKRIQGSRWSDVTDPSLTSAYFDYLQFYRTNRELSADVKAQIKTELSRARNTYKSVFVLNYAEWLMYESSGSPRLNKMARSILFEYCPFPAAIRENLTKNPQY